MRIWRPESERSWTVTWSGAARRDRSVTGPRLDRRNLCFCPTAQGPSVYRIHARPLLPRPRRRSPHLSNSFLLVITLWLMILHDWWLALPLSPLSPLYFTAVHNSSCLINHPNYFNRKLVNFLWLYHNYLMICEISFSKFLDGYVFLNIGFKKYLKNRFQIFFWKRAKNETNYLSIDRIITFSIFESPKPTKVASKMSACYCYSMLSLWASHHLSLGFLYCNIWSYGLRQYLKGLHSSILIAIRTRILRRKQRDLHLKMNKVHFWRIDWFACMSMIKTSLTVTELHSHIDTPLTLDRHTKF